MKCPKCYFENTQDSSYCCKCGSQLPLSPEVQFTKTMTLDAVQKIISKGSLFAGKYKILGVLGQGGMGIVYQAEDTKLKRIVALKFLPSELSRYPEAKERFIREAQAAAVLDHPNICTVHEVEESEGITYIAMAYVEGESLREKIAKKALDIHQAVDIALQVAEGLEAAHGRGIIHRDIKSGNVMLRKDGQARIMDFGLAKVTGEPVLTREAKTMGTVAYMSPEQARGEETDHRTDIWSLGVVLYEMLTGELPFRGERETSILYSIVHEEPRPLEKLKPGIPIQISKIVDKALRKNRISRYSTAAEMAGDLRKYQEAVRAEAAGIFNLRSLLRRLRKPQVAIPTALVLIALAGFAVVLIHRRSRISWARNMLLPELEQMIEAAKPLSPNNSFEVFSLFERASKYLPDDPKIQKLRPWCVGEVSVVTEPPRARVFVKEYIRPESEWRPIGLTPIDKGRLPSGYLRWRIEKDGYDPIEFVAVSEFLYDAEKDVYTPRTIKRILDKTGAVPQGMVRIDGRDFPEGRLEGFFVDKYEVTNLQYKEFVASGGYGKKELWTHPFLKAGKPLSWEEALALFKDSTGRPGPAAWVGGTFPEGQADYPVAGVSWYEAAAFAEFKKKALPTRHHLGVAGGVDRSHIPPLSLRRLFINIDGNGPVPVGAKQGLNSNGIYDLEGNVWEWLWNDCRDGKCIRGGAWDDPYYKTGISYLPSFERSPRVGFRCVIIPEPKKIPDFALAPHVPPAMRDYYKEKPVSDAVFEVYKEQFSYDKADLEAKVEKRDESPPDWVEEKVSFAAAYGGERVIAMLLLPKKASPPFQCIICFYGSGVVQYKSFDTLKKDTYFSDYTAPLIANGRAVLCPFYKGTFERSDPKIYWPIHAGKETRASMEYWIQIIKDFRRSIDYLETRPEIDANKIAYFGESWGGIMGAIIPAVEPRVKVSFMDMAGFYTRTRPEVDPINYITRVRIPTLIFSGKYDLKFPYETSAKPYFDLLGTPKEHKFQKVYPGDHFVAKIDFLRDSLDFLDKYLGPVK